MSNEDLEAKETEIYHEMAWTDDLEKIAIAIEILKIGEVSDRPIARIVQETYNRAIDAAAGVVRNYGQE